MDTPQENARYPRPPGREVLWEVLESGKGGGFIVTSNENRTKYYLYRCKDGALSKRLATAKTPIELQAKVL